MAANTTMRAPVDVLFTHSYHLYFDRKQAQRGQPYPPLGTLYAASLARRAGYSVALFDTMIEDPDEGFQRALDQHRPRLVVVCEDSFNFLSKMCLSRMREVSFDMQRKAAQAGIPAIVHGSDSSDNAELYLHQGFLAVLLGECEVTLIELLQAVLREGHTSNWEIPGLVYLAGPAKQLVYTRTRKPSTDFDRHPLPARDLVAMDRYAAIWRAGHGRRSTNLVASRGCPFRCNWCAKPIYGNKFMLRSAASVAEEMRILKHDQGVEHLWFADDVFALNHHWVAAFADAVEERDAAIPFKIQSRADLMTLETVKALKRAGCEEVWMGAESGSQVILDAMDKSLTVEQIKSARDRLRSAGIRAAFFLQFGYPGESLAEIEETIALVRSCRPDDIGVSVSYPLPGTVFYQRVREQLGEKRNWLDSEDLTVMFRAAYTDEFYRALRNALHQEVKIYSAPRGTQSDERVAELWNHVYRLEQRCRNAMPTQLPILQPDMETVSTCATAGCS